MVIALISEPFARPSETFSFNTSSKLGAAQRLAIFTLSGPPIWEPLVYIAIRVTR